VQAIQNIYTQRVKPALPATVSASVEKYSTLALDASKPYVDAAKTYYNKIDVAEIKKSMTVENVKSKALEVKSQLSADKISDLTKRLPTVESVKERFPTVESVKERLPSVESVKARLPTVESVMALAPASFVSAFDSIKSKAMSHFATKKDAKVASPSLAARASELFAKANDTYHFDETIKKIDSQLNLSATAKKIDAQYHVMDRVQKIVPEGIRQRFATAEAQ